MSRSDTKTPGTKAGVCCCGSAKAPGANKKIVRDPVCGMLVEPEADAPSLDYGGHVYHFCSQHCRQTFEGAPQDYISATDPVCGMDVDRARAEHFHQHHGKGYYFCSARCLEKFQAAPQTYVDGRAEPAPPLAVEYRSDRTQHRGDGRHSGDSAGCRGLCPDK